MSEKCNASYGVSELLARLRNEGKSYSEIEVAHPMVKDGKRKVKPNMGQSEEHISAGIKRVEPYSLMLTQKRTDFFL